MALHRASYTCVSGWSPTQTRLPRGWFSHSRYGATGEPEKQSEGVALTEGLHLSRTSYVTYRVQCKIKVQGSCSKAGENFLLASSVSFSACHGAFYLLFTVTRPWTPRHRVSTCLPPLQSPSVPTYVPRPPPGRRIAGRGQKGGGQVDGAEPHMSQGNKPQGTFIEHDLQDKYKDKMIKNFQTVLDFSATMAAGSWGTSLPHEPRRRAQRRLHSQRHVSDSPDLIILRS